MLKLHHVVIPVKDVGKAKKFFLDLGLKVVVEGRTPPEVKAASEDLPDEICFLVDDNGVGIDLVSYDKECPYGGGLAIAYEVDNLRQRWDSFKDKPEIRYVCSPAAYNEEACKVMNIKGGAFAFISAMLGRISNDGEEQPVELNEIHPL